MKRINPYRLFIGSFLPNWLLRRTELSQGAKLCYARLSQYAGEKGMAHPKQETMAEEIGVSIRQIRRYLDELVAYKLIESEQVGLTQANRYYFLWHDWMELESQTGQKYPLRPDKNVPSDRTDMTSQTGRIRPTEENQLRESVEENHQYIPTPSPQPQRERFEVFWKAYPNKKAKGDAWKVWQRLKPSAQLTDNMLQAIERQRASPQWTKDGGQYVPYPQKWLNQQRWDDEPDANGIGPPLQRCAGYPAKGEPGRNCPVHGRTHFYDDIFKPPEEGGF